MKNKYLYLVMLCFCNMSYASLVNPSISTLEKAISSAIKGSSTFRLDSINTIFYYNSKVLLAIENPNNNWYFSTEIFSTPVIVMAQTDYKKQTGFLTIGYSISPITSEPIDFALISTASGSNTSISSIVTCRGLTQYLNKPFSSSTSINITTSPGYIVQDLNPVITSYGNSTVPWSVGLSVDNNRLNKAYFFKPGDKSFSTSLYPVVNSTLIPICIKVDPTSTVDQIMSGTLLTNAKKYSFLSSDPNLGNIVRQYQYDGTTCSFYAYGINPITKISKTAVFYVMINVTTGIVQEIRKYNFSQQGLSSSYTLVGVGIPTQNGDGSFMVPVATLDGLSITDVLLIDSQGNCLNSWMLTNSGNGINVVTTSGLDNVVLTVSLQNGQAQLNLLSKTPIASTKTSSSSVNALNLKPNLSNGVVSENALLFKTSMNRISNYAIKNSYSPSQGIRYILF